MRENGRKRPRGKRRTTARMPRGERGKRRRRRRKRRRRGRRRRRRSGGRRKSIRR